MSQISPPLRILLVGSVLFLAAYMVFLRPGGGTDTVAPAPATTPAAPVNAGRRPRPRGCSRCSAKASASTRRV